MTDIRVIQDSNNKDVSLYYGERCLWTYHHIPVEAGQPCFHPVNTPAGYTISLLSPWDHIHHCALWFAWKLVDGINAWEGPAYEPHEPKIVPADFSKLDAGFNASYRWQKLDGTLLLLGRTECNCKLLDSGAYTLDLSYEFTTPGNKPVVLDRNPPPTAGYAGLSIRVVREFRHAEYLDADGRTEPPTRGTCTAWHTYSGPIDGGLNRRGGVALMDHPDNLRFPTPTYCIHESESFGFLQCAFLYHEPYTLNPGEPLHLRYRVMVYDGNIVGEKLKECFDDFAKS